MVNPKLIPIRFPDDKIPTKKVMQEIISAFFPQEWPFVDREAIELIYHNKFTNAHCILKRPIPASRITKEPVKVFVKLFDESIGIDAFNHLVPSKEQEAELCHQFGLSKFGPKMFGFFRTEDGTKGRIDEYLDARNMEPEDVEDDGIRADIATAMAHFHTMDTFLIERPVTAYYDALIPGLQALHKSEKLKMLGRDAGIRVDRLIDYDFAGRVKNITDALEALESQTGWCIHDVQFMNTMIKNHPSSDDSKISLIDFEMVMRNHRGFDVGGHYLHKLFKWFNEENRIANCRKYTLEEKKHFCQTYADEWNRRMKSAFTGEQIFLEGEYGYLLAITFEIHNVCFFMDKTSSADPLDLKALLKLLEEFEEQYCYLQLPELE